jgi:hypothetical protein
MDRLLRRRIFWGILMGTVTLTGCSKDSLPDLSTSQKAKDFILAGEQSSDIHYNDFNPDWDRYAFGINKDSLNIDINHDNTIDLSIQYSTFAPVNEYDVQTTVVCYNGSSICLLPKNFNDTINSHSSWQSSTALLCFTKIDFITSDTTNTGPWTGIQDKYLGVKVLKNGRNQFGWIRISLPVHPQTIYIQEVSVKEFGCRNSL